MTVQMLICRRHGGKFNRFMLPDSIRPRCAFCDMERRALQQRMEVCKVSYELQVDAGLPGYPDYATLEIYDERDRAERDMHDLLPKFRTAKMRVIKVISEEASDGVQATN